MLLGGGLSSVGDLGITTLSDAFHLEVLDVTTLGNGPETNIRLTLRPRYDEKEG